MVPLYVYPLIECTYFYSIGFMLLSLVLEVYLHAGETLLLTLCKLLKLCRPRVELDARD